MKTWQALTALCAALCWGSAHAASSVLIWPMDPVIASDQRAAALWLENRDTRPATLQIRVLGWSQANGEDVYDERQERVAGSPPMVVVPPGKRQLIRLTRLAQTPSSTEEAYRVLIDEVPLPEDQTARPESSLGVRLVMHYSIPLFAYGPGSAGRPALGWHIDHDGDKRWLVLTNGGAMHARLTGIRIGSGSGQADIEQGLLGYVLPGSHMRWLLPKELSIEERSSLTATVNGNKDVAISPDAVPTRP
jgi:fimbrial chaperone protein